MRWPIELRKSVEQTISDEVTQLSFVNKPATLPSVKCVYILCSSLFPRKETSDFIPNFTKRVFDGHLNCGSHHRIVAHILNFI